jgi:hypothetical protein|nr:MAG TPA: hypothetical protein [Caudoviricetes sp.]DAY96145.1 MAG TPA: hypothetical protein [Caudoviricetes sp.]
MLIKVHDDDTLMDVVRIRDDSSLKKNEGSTSPSNKGEECYQNPTDDVDLVLIYLLERGN